MAMFCVALVCVVVAAALEGEDRDESKPPRRSVWAVLGSTDGVTDGSATGNGSWITRVSAGLPVDIDPQIQNLSRPGSTIARARSEQLPVAIEMRPDVTTVWLVIDDLIAGTPLDSYARDLRGILDALTAAGSQVALGNVPAVQVRPEHEQFAGDLPNHRAMAEDRNRSIARIAERPGVELIDLWSVTNDQPFVVELVDGGWRLSEPALERLAGRFRPAVARAISEAKRPGRYLDADREGL